MGFAPEQVLKVDSKMIKRALAYGKVNGENKVFWLRRESLSFLSSRE